ncbi:hypothetical protein L3X38_040733 [Prunus dulcis]|uniref:Uncharacterized protein n=1 Tax=Prunus dulcis TaxID=3755 RepID=A0AAD4YJL6_PRUDU|nr:hypothetical protein L3X38_040733 [Prunus dulcis]
MAALDASPCPNSPPHVPNFPVLLPRRVPASFGISIPATSGAVNVSTCSLWQLELKLGIGGTSYEDFIRSMRLPLQLSQVDPILASFSGGAAGVISALMLIVLSNKGRKGANTAAELGTWPVLDVPQLVCA